MGDDENGAVLEWLDKIWPAGRGSQPAQKDEDEMLGPAKVQKWAANYIKSESIAVARAGEVPLPQTMDTNVYVMTTAAQAAVLANKSREDYVLPEDEHISGFVVTLALDQKWKVTWPDDKAAQGKAGGSRGKKPAQMAMVEFQTHDAFEVESFRQEEAGSTTCFKATTVAMASAVMISVLFKTKETPDPEDEDSDLEPAIDARGKFDVEEIRVDAFFLAPNGFAALTVSLVSPLMRACLPWCQLTKNDRFLRFVVLSLCTSAKGSSQCGKNSLWNRNSTV